MALSPGCPFSLGCPCPFRGVPKLWGVPAPGEPLWQRVRAQGCLCPGGVPAPRGARVLGCPFLRVYMPQGSSSLGCFCPQGVPAAESPCPREPQPRGCLSTPIAVYRWPEGFIPSLMLWQGEAPHKEALGVWVSPEHHPPASLPCGSLHIVRAPSQHAGLLHRLPSVAPIRVQNRQEDSLAWGCEGAQACTPGLLGLP